MSDSKFIIAFFVLLAAGKTIMIIQCLRSRNHSTSRDMETGPEVLVEDPMTQRLVLAGEVAVDDRQQPEMADVIQVPPPVYTIKDQHLEFENDPPPPSFRDAVPSSPFSPLSPFLHKPKPSRRKPSRSSSSGSQSNTSTIEQHRLSRHQIFRYHPASTDVNNSNINGNDNDNVAEPVAASGSSVRRPAATAVEPTVIRIHNVARWVAESRRDTFQAFAGSSSSSSEHPSFDFVSADANPDTYCHNSEPYGSSSASSSSLSSSTAGNMRILPSMGVLYPSVIVHM